MIENGINFLFNQFPRDVGIPNYYKKGSFYRKQVTCARDFQRYLSLMSGSSAGTYTSVYDTNDRVVVDKIVFDFDSKDLITGLTDVEILSDRLHERNIPYLVVFSGKKGFHVWCLLKPEKMGRDIAGYYLGNLQRSLIGGLGTIDTHLIGNASAMIRIPNTLNNGRYCSPLPFEFRKMSIEEILDYSRTQHSINFFPGELKTIKELAGDIKLPQRDNREEFKDEIKVGSIPSMEILEELIRPCVIKEVQKSNPCTTARLDFVSEMMFAVFTRKQILDIIKGLEWENFDERMTNYQISKIFERKVKPYSCQKLKPVLNCIDCNFYYYWNTK